MHHGCIYSKTKQTSTGDFGTTFYSMECVNHKVQLLGCFSFKFFRHKMMANKSDLMWLNSPKVFKAIGHFL